MEEAAAATAGVTVALGYSLHGLLLACLGGARIVALGDGRIAAAVADVPGATVLTEPIEVEAVADATIAAVGVSDALVTARRRHARARCDEARNHLRAVAMNGSPVR